MTIAFLLGNKGLTNSMNVNDGFDGGRNVMME